MVKRSYLTTQLDALARRHNELRSAEEHSAAELRSACDALDVNLASLHQAITQSLAMERRTITMVSYFKALRWSLPLTSFATEREEYFLKTIVPWIIIVSCWIMDYPVLAIFVYATLFVANELHAVKRVMCRDTRQLTPYHGKTIRISRVMGGQALVYPALDGATVSFLPHPDGFGPYRLQDMHSYVLFTERDSMASSHCIDVPDMSNEKATVLPQEERGDMRYFDSLHEPLAEAGRLMAAVAERALAHQLAESDLDTIQLRREAIERTRLEWAAVALPATVIDEITKMVDMFARGVGGAGNGLLLYGPPGTGKTVIAKTLASTSSCAFFPVSAAHLKSDHVGGTPRLVNDIWDNAVAHAPSILFVDECEGVFAKRGSADADSFSSELVQTFLARWDGLDETRSKVFVVGASNRSELIDEALASRFTRAIEIGLPDEKAREKILHNEFASAGLDYPVSLDLTKDTAGMSGRDLKQLVSIIATDAYGGELSDAAVKDALRRLRGKTASRTRQASWADIVLPDEVLHDFVTLGKELKHAERLREMDIDPPHSVLLYGPPGTGKTQLARVLANESGLAFVTVATAELKKAYLGQSGQAVRQLFERARSQSPCILFIDELEVLAPSRTGAGDALSSEIVGQLLQEMDGVARTDGQVFVMAATNHSDKIDDAILSRFEKRIKLGLPDLKAREAIITMLLKRKPLDFVLDKGVPHLARQTRGMSGRDLKSMVANAARKAVKRSLDGGKTDDLYDVVLRLDDFSLPSGPDRA